MNDINSVEDALTKAKNFKSKGDSLESILKADIIEKPKKCRNLKMKNSKYNRKKIIKQDDFNKEFEDEIKQHVLGDKNK